MYDQLPTRKTKSRWDKTIPHTCRQCEHDETFTHLMRCKHAVSISFRNSLINEVQEYCNTLALSMVFTTIFTQALQDWLENVPILQGVETLERIHPHIAAQSQIGWDAFIKGFMSRKWLRFLHFGHARKGSHQMSKEKLTSVLANLICILWKNMSNLWTNHLNHIHQKSSAIHFPDKVEELKVKIRCLYQQKNKVLATHCKQYFHSDIEHFLATDKASQLKCYLLTYTSAIYASIKQAKAALPNRNLLCFPGFFLDTTATILLRTPSTNVRSEEPTHHSHNRWKPREKDRVRFYNHFLPKTKNRFCNHFLPKTTNT